MKKYNGNSKISHQFHDLNYFISILLGINVKIVLEFQALYSSFSLKINSD